MKSHYFIQLSFLFILINNMACHEAQNSECDGNCPADHPNLNSPDDPNTCFTNDPNATAAYINGKCVSICHENFIDIDGICTAVICKPGSVTCNDSNTGLMVCRHDGTGYDAGSACTTDDPNALKANCYNSTCRVICKDNYTNINDICMQVSCIPGEKSCADNQVIACNLRGTGYDMIETCTTIKHHAKGICIDNACSYTCKAGYTEVEGHCIEVTCEPGTVICNEQSNGLLVCKADGSGYETSSACTTDDPNASGTVCRHGVCQTICKPGFIEIGGICKAISCTPNEKSCAVDKVIACHANGTNYEILETCTTAKPHAKPLCLDNACTYACDAGFVDVNGVCTPITCEPGSIICNDARNGLLICNTDGTGYQSGNICRTNDPNALGIQCVNGTCQVVCNSNFVPIEGICKAVSCIPNEKSCAIDKVVACNADGTHYEILETCSTNKPHAKAVCNDGACSYTCNAGFVDVNGTCSAMTCTPGSAICNDKADGLMICKPDGTGYEKSQNCTTDKPNAVSICEQNACQVRCQEHYIDVNGVCIPVICNPGQLACHVFDPIVLRCDKLGIYESYEQICTVNMPHAKPICENGQCGFACYHGYAKTAEGCRPYLTFKDPIFEVYALNAWDTDKNGYITDDEADAVTMLNHNIFNNSGVQTLEDLNQFKNLTYFSRFSISHEQNLTELRLEHLRKIDLYFVYYCNNIEMIQMPRLNQILDIYPFMFAPKLHTVVMTSPGEIILPSNTPELTFEAAEADGYRPENVTLYLNKDKLMIEPKITPPNRWANQTWKAIYVCGDYTLKDNFTCELVRE